MGDVRYALRLLRQSPVFALTGIVSLAIGIGANATIFSVVSAMLIRPLPGLDHPDRLVDVGRTHNSAGFDTTSYLNYRDVRARATTFSGVFAYGVEPRPMSLADGNGAERIFASPVSGNYFSVLGTRATVGRLFADGDDAPGHADAVVISYQLWQRRFGGQVSAVGQVIVLTGQHYEVIGVAPPGFQGTTAFKSDLWIPLSTEGGGPDHLLEDREAQWLMMGGRLKPRVTIAQANAEISTIGRILAQEYPEANTGKGLRVVQQSILPGRIGVIAGFVGLLMAIVATVLAIACVNLAGMMLARAVARQREIAVRMAIGASRGRLIRQLLTESALLFSAGCIAGLALSRWLISLLLALLPALPFPVALNIQIEWRVVLFSVATAATAAVAAGLAPALRATRSNLVSRLNTGGWASTARLRLRSVLVIAQITLSLALVVVAGLFLRAIERAASIDPGFDQRNVSVVSLDLSLGGLTNTSGPLFAHDLLQRVAALPRIGSAVLATALPLDGERTGLGPIHIPEAPDRPAPDADWNLVTPGYFRTLEIALLRGRDFADTDTASSPAVVIVNAVLARDLWPAAAALGQQVLIDNGQDGVTRATVVGIAANARDRELDQETPTIYAPLAQHYRSGMALVVRSAAPDTPARIRALIATMNPNLPAIFAMPLSEVTAINLVPQRMAAAVAGVLGVIGLLLGAMGIYGVTAYSVQRRMREMGIRVALGADGQSVLRLILRQSLALTSIGLVIGLGISALASEAVRSLLFGVSALDPLTFAGSGALFVVVAVAASLGPARRAARVDPMVTLRAE